MDSLWWIFWQWLLFILSFLDIWSTWVLTDLYFDFVYIVFKVTFFLRPIWEYHFTISMLDAPDPLTLVTASICPVHLSIPVSFIVFIFSFVDITASPLEYPVAVLFVSVVVTLVAVALGASCTSPLTFSLFHSSFEISDVAGTIGPCVLAFSIWFPIDVFTCV